jgi:hypothetical protein
MTAFRDLNPEHGLEQMLLVLVYDPTLATPTSIAEHVDELEGVAVYSVDPDVYDEEADEPPGMVDVPLPEPVVNEPAVNEGRS